jgi:hypothetical protein
MPVGYCDFSPVALRHELDAPSLEGNVPELMSKLNQFLAGSVPAKTLSR